MDERFESSLNPSRRAHFFGLPRELRDEIYDLCLIEYPNFAPISSLQGPRWLWTCKQILVEGRTAFYRKRCWHVTTQFSASKQSLLHEMRMHLVYHRPVVNPCSAMRSFDDVKDHIRQIAVEILLPDILHLDDIYDHFHRYFDGIGQLASLGTLYISMCQRSDESMHDFEAQGWLTLCIARNGFGYFGSVLKRAVSLLKRSLPPRCSLVWGMPDISPGDGTDRDELSEDSTESRVRKHMSGVLQAISESVEEVDDHMTVPHLAGSR